jgi:hypothetical protein
MRLRLPDHRGRGVLSRRTKPLYEGFSRPRTGSCTDPAPILTKRPRGRPCSPQRSPRCLQGGAARNCFRFAKARALPAGVLGPVDIPPWKRQRPFRSSCLHWQAVPRRVREPHTGRPYWSCGWPGRHPIPFIRGGLEMISAALSAQAAHPGVCLGAKSQKLCMRSL